jgi:hypothetical protein
MRLQTSLCMNGQTICSGIVRAENIEQALERLISTRDIARAHSGFAYPINQQGPKPDDWRWSIRCSVTGKVTMSRKKPGKGSGSDYSNK